MSVARVLEGEADIFSRRSVLSPFSPMQTLLRERTDDDPVDRPAFVAGPGVVEPFEGDGEKSLGLNAVPFVVYSLVAFAAMTAGALALAARLLAVPRAA